jgi:hypothetical protein
VKSSDGKYPVAQDDEERNVLELVRDVNAINSHIPGSAAARVNMRNEIRGLMMKVGLPIFFITVNLADTRDPIVKFLAGNDIDVDALLPEEAQGRGTLNHRHMLVWLEGALSPNKIRDRVLKESRFIFDHWVPQSQALPLVGPITRPGFCRFFVYSHPSLNELPIILSRHTCSHA